MANINKTYVLSFYVKNGDDVEKVNVELGKTAKSVGELEHQIETLTAAIKKAEFGTPEFAKLTKELGNAKTKLVNFEESIADITKAEKVEGLFRIGSAIAGGFAIAEAASAAYGDQLGLNQEQIAKTTAKFQVLLVTIESLQLVQEALGKENKFLTQLLARNSVATGAQTAATNKLTLATVKARLAQIKLNIAQAANPIVAVTLAIAGLVAGLYAFTQAGEKTKNVIRVLTVLFTPLLAPILFVVDAIKTLVDNLGGIKDFIAETTGLFDTEAQKQKKIKDAQFLEDKARIDKLKEISKQSIEDVTNIYRTQTKLRNASAGEQLQVEEKILQLQLKNLQKEYDEKYKASNKFNQFLKDNTGLDAGLGEKTNAEQLKILETESKIKDIQKQRLQQALADEINLGEKRLVLAKLAGEDELKLAKIRKNNFQSQIKFVVAAYGAESLEVLKLKEQILDTSTEINGILVAQNQEVTDLALRNIKLQGATDVEYLTSKKIYYKDLFDLTKKLYGDQSKEARKYEDEILAIDKELSDKLFTKIDTGRLDAAIAQQKAEKEAKDQFEKEAKEKRIKDAQEAVAAVISVYAALGEALTAQIDERIAQSQEKIAELDQQASDSVARSEALTATLDEARGARRLDAIRQIESERQKQKQLADEKLKQEQKIQVEEKKKQRLLTTTNAINQTTAAINVIVANSEALKGVFSQTKTPFPANIVAIGATIAAVVAAAAAIKSIKFAKGGATGAGYGAPDETGYKPAGIVHEHEYVVPKRVLETSQGSELVGKLEYMRKGFAGGGFTSNLVPNFSGISSSIDASQMLMIQKLDELKATNIALANRKTVVSVEAIDKVQSEVSKIKVNATI